MSDYIVDEPERINVKFNVNLSDIPVEWQNKLLPLYQLAESEVFEWNNISIEPPKSIFSRFDVKKVDLGIDNCFNENECEQLALDSDANRKRLNKEQLSDLKRTGQFQVQSVQFPEKFHVWRVNQWLLKGTEPTVLSFKQDIARVIRLIIITARNRFKGRYLSAKSAIRHVWKGTYQLIDLLIGLPHVNPGNVEVKLKEECLQFLTCELNVSRLDQSKLSEFWDYLEKLSCLPILSKADNLQDTDKDMVTKGIYRFVTPGNLMIDLRLTNSSLKSKCITIVERCISHISQSDWFIEFKTNYIDKIFSEGLTLEMIEKSVIDASTKAMASRIFEKVQDDCNLSSIPESIYNSMVENAKFYLICQEVSDKIKERWTVYKADFIEEIKQAHPILSMISSWMRENLISAEMKFVKENKDVFIKMILDRCCSDSLLQHDYLTKRHYIFLKERKPLIERQLLKDSCFPDRIYHFQSEMTLHRFWKITSAKTSEGKTVYNVDKHKRLQWSTYYPFWRWINCCFLAYTWMLTIGQFLLIKLPFKTRISYLSLFLKQPFVTKYIFDTATGNIRPSMEHRVPTLCSRLERLWHHVWKARAKFESSVFSGLLDKSVARHFHRLWTIVLQGGVGTFGLVIFMPLTCLLMSSLSCVIGVLVPVWVPLAAAAACVCSITFYDFFSPRPRQNKLFCLFEAIFWHILWCGLIQFWCQLFISMILLPICAVTYLLISCLRLGIRYVWDTFIFYVIMKRHGYIPASNDFITKRISGPGLAYDYEIMIRPEHVLTGLWCYLEKLELDMWLEQAKMIIQKPMTNYRKFVDQTLKPLGVLVNSSDKIVSRIIQSEQKALDVVCNLYSKQVEKLNISSFERRKDRNKFRLTSDNLKTVLAKSEQICQLFYTERLYPRINQLGIDENYWWNDRNLRKLDFKTFAVNNLSYLFGDQILSSMEDCDEVFQIETNELTMNTYIDMFVSEEYEEDLDKIKVISSRWSSGMTPEFCHFKLRNMKVPFIPASAFFVRQNSQFPEPMTSHPDSKYRRKPSFKWVKKTVKWMKGRGKGYNVKSSDDGIPETLDVSNLMNLELYHPIIICTLLHSRDRDNSMLNLSHKAVFDGVQKLMKLPYDQDLLDDINPTLSIDNSNNSLEDMCNDPLLSDNMVESGIST